MDPVFFEKPSDLYKWFEKNHFKEKELLVGFYKVNSGRPSITWSESVDQALCFGWIDGVRKSIDDESYCIRFTPRRPTSIWSAVNIKKMETLKKQGVVQPEGLRAFEIRKENKSKVYSYENVGQILDPVSEKKLNSNKKAANFFYNQAPSYQKAAIHWVMNAKREETKQKRLMELVTDSENEKKLKHLSYSKK